MWYKIVGTALDGATSPPQTSGLSLEGRSLTELLLRLNTALLTMEAEAECYPESDLVGRLVIHLDVSTWISSKSCERPGALAQQILHETTDLLNISLFCSVGSLRPGTGTKANGSSPS